MLGKQITVAELHRLEAELQYRTEVLRPKIQVDLDAAKAKGDFAENDAYTEAYGAKKQNETRIQHIQQILEELNQEKLAWPQASRELPYEMQQVQYILSRQWCRAALPLEEVLEKAGSYSHGDLQMVEATAMAAETELAASLLALSALAPAELSRQLPKLDTREEGWALTMDWFRRMAESGSAAAQYLMGLFCKSSRFPDEKKEDAAVWFRKAAEQGHVGAMDSLGSLVDMKSAPEQDRLQAFTWFLAAAEKGYAPAQVHVAQCYRDGLGVNCSPDLEFSWFQKAAYQGDADGQQGLGLCYSLGHGVSQDHQEALRWYLKAAEKGNRAALFNAAGSFSWGPSPDHDLAEAVLWCRRAAACSASECSVTNLKALYCFFPDFVQSIHGSLHPDLS